MKSEDLAKHIKGLFLNVLLSRRIAGPVKAQKVALHMSKKCKDKKAKNVLFRFSTMTLKEFNASSAMLESKMLS